MTTDKHITFKTNGGTVLCTAGSSVKIFSIAGVASLETEHNVIVTPFMPGAQTTHIHDKQRFIRMELSLPVRQRDFYLHFFRVNAVGTMFVQYGDRERFIDYIISESTVEQPTVCEDPSLVLTFRCAYPYFKDVDGFGENLGEKVPMIWQGFVWEANRPFVAAYARHDSAYAVTNTGEVPVGFYALIKTTSAAKNPKIMLTGHESAFMRVLADLTVGDELEISTVAENGNLPESGKDVFVRLNGENILSRTDQFSTPFQIKPGRHQISYDADDGAETLQIWFYRHWAWTWA